MRKGPLIQVVLQSNIPVITSLSPPLPHEFFNAGEESSSSTPTTHKTDSKKKVESSNS